MPIRAPPCPPTHVSGAVSGPAAPADLTVSGAVSAAAADLDVGEQVAPEPDEDADITAELLLGDGPAPVREARERRRADRPPATVYYPVPAVAAVRLPLLRRPPVLLSILVALLAVAAGAGFLGVRSGSPEGLAGAAAVTSAAVTGLAAPPPALSPSGVAGVGVAWRWAYTCRIGTCEGLDESVGAAGGIAVRGRRRAARPGR